MDYKDEFRQTRIENSKELTAELTASLNIMPTTTLLQRQQIADGLLIIEGLKGTTGPR
jgi:hypothetical protein